MTITFPIVTHCVVCEQRLQPMADIRCWDKCDDCVKAGREFAKDLGPEHEQESPDAV